MPESRSGRNPYWFALAWAGGVTAATTVLLQAVCAVPAVGAYFAAVNLAALMLMRCDKAAARRSAARIPEAVFHVMSLLGGAPGVILGMVLARHKTRKGSFQAVTAVILLIYVLLWVKFGRALF